ncbi:MAG: PQQ-dependent sugar dehydrogenase [Oligoflexia bacterium]|nr:PQQ-dependent sugar dehydrogenase [Oligoflexia bacterium]
MRRCALIIAVFICLADVSASPKANSFKTSLTYKNLNFSAPTDIQVASGSEKRMFVAERAGRILAFGPSKSASSSSVFLDISDRVTSAADEEGLLGFAFHPDYSTNGYIFVNYTAAGPLRTVISRFQRSASNAAVADSSTELVLLEFDQPFSNHNGGQLAFSPGGYLYIATGDGGSAGDPNNNAQSLGTYLGKILRIDVDSTDSGKNYAIPSGNPFVSNSSAKAEIYAYGFRNPWRISFDSVTKKLWAADVGQDAREEIDLVAKGKNYGWRIREGSACYNPNTGCRSSGLSKPTYEYGHALGESITGGYVYRGKKFPELVGYYIYADFISGTIWALSYPKGKMAAKSTRLVDTSLLISTFGQSRSGELYLASYGDGRIYQLARK